MFFTPKERPHLVLQLFLNKFFQNSAEKYKFQPKNLKLKSLGRRVLVIFSLISAFGRQKHILIVKISSSFLHQKKGLT